MRVRREKKMGDLENFQINRWPMHKVATPFIYVKGHVRRAVGLP